MSISISVLEGRVLMTGSVVSNQCADDAVKTAWSIKGVREVINEINVEMKAIKNSANDTLIEQAISSRFLVEKNFMSTNYKIAVNNSIAYLLGIAQNKDEMEKALSIASNTKGVDRVVNYIILKDDPRRGK